jgi:hypothetical protein
MSRVVTKAEFDAFIAAYPRKLIKDVCAVGEPALLSYNDFTVAPQWPGSIVASVILYEDSYPDEDGNVRPNEYHINGR